MGQESFKTPNTPTGTLKGPMRGDEWGRGGSGTPNIPMEAPNTPRGTPNTHKVTLKRPIRGD